MGVYFDILWLCVEDWRWWALAGSGRCGWWGLLLVGNWGWLFYDCSGFNFWCTDGNSVLFDFLVGILTCILWLCHLDVVHIDAALKFHVLLRQLLNFSLHFKELVHKTADRLKVWTQNFPLISVNTHAIIVLLCLLFKHLNAFFNCSHFLHQHGDHFVFLFRNRFQRHKLANKLFGKVWFILKFH